ncbi:MAG TPA: hypothetical protein VJ648_05940, partial [Vicinamibacteria bacterium]|nr:hypothetical protein [Vicinamibacteria bacterium]
MKAILLTKHGRPEVLSVVEVAEPVPERDQVRVRVETIGLNYAEVLSRQGQYGWAPPLPYVPGMEAYGEVEAVVRKRGEDRDPSLTHGAERHLVHRGESDVDRLPDEGCRVRYGSVPRGIA